ncbi:hypothetical protein CS006_10510 [Bifidobacterium primatium]|uniref:Single-stranded DNA-binding protein n=2 Tax=Bifidobacterium TaxID=1678 RepID=A0A2M9H6B7_9BIFI|nr:MULTISPECIES: single-stranded DNA-binding protein [Bifidobacterium]NEG95987.1 single-stranded DNA-binding protein [Bifidobacterium sp. SMB2]NEH12452.1 single-stranded DNA-binding protein [Bifidobacterium saimiriisciurei]PJM72359.1 hypothetical protein CS006_10510 [Bifidobacterium primatium]
MAVNTCLQGNVGAEPVTRTFNNGNSVTTFRVGVNQGYYDQSRQWVDQGTMWVEVECSPSAAVQLPWVHKGSRVLVYGLLSQRLYKKKDGTDGSSLRLYAQALGFVHSRKGQPPTAGFAGAQQQAGQWQGGPQDNGFGEPDF